MAESTLKLLLLQFSSSHYWNVRSFTFNSQCPRTFCWWILVSILKRSSFRIHVFLTQSSWFQVLLWILTTLALQESFCSSALQTFCFFQQMTSLALGCIFPIEMFSKYSYCWFLLISSEFSGKDAQRLLFVKILTLISEPIVPSLFS